METNFFILSILIACSPNVFTVILDFIKIPIINNKRIRNLEKEVKQLNKVVKKLKGEKRVNKKRKFKD